jgi:hypothetical protein
MTKIPCLASVAGNVAIAATSAQDSDLATPSAKAPASNVVTSVPIFSWVGCQIGAQGGWGWGREHIT